MQMTLIHLNKKFQFFLFNTKKNIKANLSRVKHNVNNKIIHP